jgi:hypothetical protein
MTIRMKTQGPLVYSLLEFVSPELCENDIVVMAAVRRDGLSLRFASNKLKDNEYIVIAAVKNNRDALKYASLRLRNDINVVMAAITSDDHEYEDD